MQCWAKLILDTLAVHITFYTRTILYGIEPIGLSIKYLLKVACEEITKFSIIIIDINNEQHSEKAAGKRVDEIVGTTTLRTLCLNVM